MSSSGQLVANVFVLPTIWPVIIYHCEGVIAGFLIYAIYIRLAYSLSERYVTICSRRPYQASYIYITWRRSHSRYGQRMIDSQIHKIGFAMASLDAARAWLVFSVTANLSLTTGQTAGCVGEYHQEPAVWPVIIYTIVKWWFGSWTAQYIYTLSISCQNITYKLMMEETSYQAFYI